MIELVNLVELVQLFRVTGFGNAVISAAIEHRTEGFVLGVGGNMFKLAGSVILFGVFSAFVIALIKTHSYTVGWFVMLIGIVHGFLIRNLSLFLLEPLEDHLKQMELLSEDFDLLHADLWLDQDSYEKAHRVLFEEACQKAMEKAGNPKRTNPIFLGGDLINQITPTSFACRTIGAPYLGLFGACSTSMEGLALGAYIINAKGAKYILTGASSHNAAVEKQFRYPTEYGGQKPPTAQWTVTGAGAALLSDSGEGPRVTSSYNWPGD